MLLLPWSSGVAAQAQGYRVYGGVVEVEEKNEQVEACEVRELVEKQRCNNRINKTACIEEVHRECEERFGDRDTDEESDPPTEG